MWTTQSHLGFFFPYLCVLNIVGFVSISTLLDHIGGVMVSVLALSAIDREFEPQTGQTKDYEIGICCFSTKHAVLRKKSKYWLTQIQDNVSEWSDMSTREQLFR
jgi:hypothetical protein